MNRPTVLAFPDRKTGGAVPVLGADGNPVATIHAASRQRPSFEVNDPGGAVLCSVGKTGVFTRTYDVTDIGGHSLLTVKQGWRASAAITTADGREYTLGGRSHTFALMAADGEIIARAAKGKTSSIFHSDDYTVEIWRSDFTVGELVAVIEIHRREQKRRRAASAGA
jgi:hypothetical protein